MSGYLQRLVSGVLKPDVAIHPVLPSRFAPPSPPPAPEIIEVEEETAIANRREPVREFGPDQQRPEVVRQPANEPQVPSIAPPAPVFPPPPLTEAVNHSSVSAPAQGAARSKTSAATPVALVEGSKAAAKPGFVASANRQSAFQENRQALAQRRFASPFTNKPPEILELPPTRASAGPSSVVAGERRRNEFSGRGRNSYQPIQQVPDEIQIHIGRIEVTAVTAAPAPQRVPKPSNLPSLDEYLKRRDGRA
jgi:hypothetical protein